uniref:Uncharacterized protein n=1 Tax=Trypanosoma vivax (strain Y486) TaxID=1055687 RepID=G0U833_TRYVY|nr:hypothetical protein, conserved in T. vivax [Trypanosoma vivax Y486]
MREGGTLKVVLKGPRHANEGILLCGVGAGMIQRKNPLHLRFRFICSYVSIFVPFLFHTPAPKPFFFLCLSSRALRVPHDRTPGMAMKKVYIYIYIYDYFDICAKRDTSRL